MPAGHVFRIVTLEGPQVADFNMWNLHNPRERMWACARASCSRPTSAPMTASGRRCPYLRPMATITEDTLASYGVDSDGGRVHDLLGTRCDPYVNKLLTGEDFHFHCHSNPTRAVAPHGLTELDARRAQRVPGHRPERRRQVHMKACPAQPGDYLEMFAEIDLLCALSTCPGGDLSVPMWAPEARDPIDVPAAGRRGLCAGSGAAARLDIARSFTV